MLHSSSLSIQTQCCSPLQLAPTILTMLGLSIDLLPVNGSLVRLPPFFMVHTALQLYVSCVAADALETTVEAASGVDPCTTFGAPSQALPSIPKPSNTSALSFSFTSTAALLAPPAPPRPAPAPPILSAMSAAQRQAASTLQCQLVALTVGLIMSIHIV